MRLVEFKGEGGYPIWVNPFWVESVMAQDDPISGEPVDGISRIFSQNYDGSQPSLKVLGSPVAVVRKLTEG